MELTSIEMIRELRETPGFWYLGSPYSKYPLGHERAARVIEQIAGELMKLGVRLFCPIAHSHAIAVASGIDPFCHKTWMDQDLAFTPAAVGLIVAKMQSWEISTGLTQEQREFVDAQKPVYYLDPVVLGFERV